MRNKLIAAGAGLFGYGVLIGWAVTGDLLEKKLRNEQTDIRETLGEVNDRLSQRVVYLEDLLATIPMTEEEIEVLENSIGQMKEEEQAPKSENSPVGVKPETVVGTTPDGFTAYSDADEVADKPEVPAGETPEQTKDRLRGIINRYVGDPDEVHDFESRALAYAEADQTPPFVISQTSFASDPDEGDEYDKVSLTYFPNERVLVDEEEEVQDDVAAVIGWKNLNRFGDESGDATVVFVRNRRLRTDYEVVLDTENQPPLHVRYGMPRQEFLVQKAAGAIRFRPEDE